MIENVLVMSQVLPKLVYDKSPKKTIQSKESKELINKRAQIVFLMNYILCGMISNMIRKRNNNVKMFVIIPVYRQMMDVPIKVSEITMFVNLPLI